MALASASDTRWVLLAFQIAGWVTPQASASFASVPNISTARSIAARMSLLHLAIATGTLNPLVIKFNRVLEFNRQGTLWTIKFGAWQTLTYKFITNGVKFREHRT
jgi:hypothetical protein